MVQNALAQNNVKTLPKIRLFIHQAALNGFDGVGQFRLDCLDQIRVKVMGEMKPETPLDLFSKGL